LLRFEKSLGISHVCLIQISVYKTDNRLLLDTLRDLKGQARGVVVIDPDTITERELDEMHAVGVRGVRLNLKTTGVAPSREHFTNLLQSYARRLRPRNWALQIYLTIPQFKLIAEEIPKLSNAEGSVPVIIDHLGHPDQTRPVKGQEGYEELMAALRRREIFIKLSGTYRFPNLPDLETYAREVLRTAPTQVIWASDWPHTGSVENNPGGNRKIHQDYRRVDDVGFVKQCVEWCDGNQGLMHQVWVDNPRRLWQYGATPVQQKL
jgi:predicted TIM-barrel fold metal-dependent hydrolase